MVLEGMSSQEETVCLFLNRKEEKMYWCVSL